MAASLDTDGCVRLWDVRAGGGGRAMVGELPASEGVTCARLGLLSASGAGGGGHSGGPRLIVGTSAGRVRLYDLSLLGRGPAEDSACSMEPIRSPPTPTIHLCTHNEEKALRRASMQGLHAIRGCLPAIRACLRHPHYGLPAILACLPSIVNRPM